MVNDKKVIGNNVKETIGWEITVRNNNQATVKIIIEDQIPISEIKSVSVESLDYSNAKKSEKTGLLTWELFLKPNEKKVVGYKYTVKYPSYSSVALE